MKTIPKKISAVVGIYINNTIFIALTVFLLCFMTAIAKVLQSNIINLEYNKSTYFILITD